MTAPNIITIGRILAVPLTIWLLTIGHYQLAFALFIAAGISDGVDGFIAKRYHMETVLGAYLDPLADKLLLVSIYIALGMQQVVPAFLVIVIVSRDVLIVGAIMLSWLLDRPVKMEPLLLSKVNTVAQILLAGAVLAALGFGFSLEVLVYWGTIAVAVLTLASGAQYMRDWIRHMANGSGVPTS